MPLTVAEAALRVPGARARSLILFKPKDPNQDDATVLVAVTDAADVSTEPGDSPPNLGFVNLVAERGGARLEEYLTSAGQLTGPSQFRKGSVTVEHGSDAWKDYRWRGQPFEYRVGAREDATGQAMAFADYDLLFNGLIDRFESLGDNRYRISFADQRLAFESRISPRSFRGFGGGYHVYTSGVHASGDRAWLTKNHDAAMDIVTGMGVVWVGRLSNDVSAHLLLNGGLSDMNYGLLVESGSLKFGSNAERVSVAIPGSVDVTKLVAFGARVSDDPVPVVTLYAGNSPESFDAAIGSGTLSGPLSTTTSPFTIGRDLDSDFLACEVVVFGVSEPSEETMKKAVEGPTSDAPARSEILESWRFSEGTIIGAGPDIVFGEKGVFNFEKAGSGDARWESSWDTSDPDLFSGSLAGQTVPRLLGRAFNVPLALLDHQRRDYGWADPYGAPSHDLLVLRQNGVPMVSDWAVALADVDFDATDKTATSLTVGQSFSKMIPEQDDPPRLGQRVVVTGTSNNNKTFRVEAVNEDGDVATLANAGVTTESATGVYVSPVTEDVQYKAFSLLGSFEPSLSQSAIRLVSAAQGELTADVIGEVSGTDTYKWSELAEIILGQAPDISAVTFDPPLGLWVPPGSDMTKNQALDALARSAFGWWVEEPDGSYRMGNFAPPSGSAVATIDDGLQTTVTPLPVLDPFWRFRVGFQKNYHPQAKENLASSVSAADRQSYTSPFSWLPHTDPELLRNQPTAEEHDDIETLLTDRANAALFRDLAAPMITAAHSWYRLVVPSFWAYFIKLNDVIHVELSDPTLDLSSANLRVTGRVLDAASYQIELEAFR